MFDRKTIIVLLFVLTPITRLLSQDSTWKKMVIDENLTISFPGEVRILDTSAASGKTRARIKTYSYQQDSFVMMAVVTVLGNETNKSTPSMRQKALREFSEGLMQSYSKKGFTCIVSDSIIHRMNCKKIVCKGETIPLINNFVFVAKNKMYSLQTFFYGNTDTSFEALRTNSFLSTVHFEKSIIEAQEFDSLETSGSYQIGYYSVPVLIIIIVVIIVIRKSRARKEQKTILGE